jgi:hypothetical protein
MVREAAEARLRGTFFEDVDLTGAIGLEQCLYQGPSTVDHRTLQKSGPLPLAFLRGVGLPDNAIDTCCPWRFGASLTCCLRF